MADIRIRQVQHADHMPFAAERNAEHRAAGFLRLLVDLLEMPRIVPTIRDEQRLILLRRPAGQALSDAQPNADQRVAPRPFRMFADQLVRPGFQQPERDGKGVQQRLHLFQHRFDDSVQFQRRPEHLTVVIQQRQMAIAMLHGFFRLFALCDVAERG